MSDPTKRAHTEVVSEHERPRARLWLQILVGVLVITFGAAVAGGLYLLRSEPAQTERPRVGPLVEATTVKRENVTVEVRGFGSVQPRVKVQVVPQVGGAVVDVHEQLVDGGSFKAGEMLIQIDRTDYELSVDRAEAALAQAEAEVERTKADILYAEARLDDAEQELERIEELASTGAATPRELRKQQLARRLAQARLKSARARLAAAEATRQSTASSLKSAEVDLERTTVTVPFDGYVVDEQVDVGQYLVAGQPVATVYGSDAVEVSIPLRDSELQWLLSTKDSAGQSQNRGVLKIGGTGRTYVTTEFAGERHVWPAEIVRIEGEVDPKSRMVNVVVSVPRPFNGRDRSPPLVPGMFVEVVMEGRSLEGVARVPRAAVRDGAYVWVVEDGRLRIREVNVLRREQADALLGAGVDDGDILVLTNLETVADGMLVRPSLLGSAGSSPNTTASAREEDSP